MLVFLLVLIPTNVVALKDTIDLKEYEIEYSYDETDVLVGESFRLSITITNVDDQNHTDIEFSWEDDFPFDPDDNDLEIDLLEPEESKSKSFRIEVSERALSEEYSLDFSLEDDQDDYEDTIDIEVESITPDLIVADVQSLPTTLQPDLEDVELTVALENIGDGDAYFVRAQLVLPSGFEPATSYADNANLGIVRKGERKEATFFIDTKQSLEEGTYSARLQLDFEDEEDNKKFETLTFELPIKGKPSFALTLISSTPRLIVPGTTGILSITIKNTGTEEGSGTSVRVFENSDLPFSFEEKTNMVGSLEPGETGTATFAYTVDDDAIPKNYRVKVQTRTVNNGDVLVKETSVNIPVRESPENAFDGSLITVVLLALLIVLLAVAGILFLKAVKR